MIFSPRGYSINNNPQDDKPCKSSFAKILSESPNATPMQIKGLKSTAVIEIIDSDLKKVLSPDDLNRVTNEFLRKMQSLGVALFDIRFDENNHAKIETKKVAGEKTISFKMELNDGRSLRIDVAYDEM